MSGIRAQRLEIVGELTIQSAAEHKAALLALLDSGAPIELHLADVTELDTAGLQLLLMVKREAAQLGRRLTLRAPSPVVVEVLAIAHLNQLLSDPPVARRRTSRSTRPSRSSGVKEAVR